METETRLVFQTIGTSTCEEIGDDAYIIDVSTLNGDDVATMEDYDHYGVLSADQVAIVRRVGVPVADLWAAYKREQQRNGGAS